MDEKYLSRIVDAAIAEDLGTSGDITSSSVLSNEEISFSINAREELVVCGIPILEEIFNRNKKDIEYTIHKQDGDVIGKNTTIVSGKAKAIALLPLERVTLNFLQHASGIASITRKFVEAIKGAKAKIRDTRKTTPGLRLLEKYAVKLGGGESYRLSLDDGILIKDNHIASCGNITSAVERIREKKQYKDAFIAVECDTLEQVKEAISVKVGMILLDNMNVTQLKEVVKIANGRVILEASGGVTLDNVRAIAETGVDYISIGIITHSANNKDIGLDVVALNST